jgi:hypothetical protein
MGCLLTHFALSVFMLVISLFFFLKLIIYVSDNVLANPLIFLGLVSYAPTMRIVVPALTLVLLLCTVLLPSTSIFGPKITAEEAQMPCEDAPCGENNVYLDESLKHLNFTVNEYEDITWIHKHHLKSQHISDELHRPPALS